MPRSMGTSALSVPWLAAQMWWCGDDHCDCHQPQIDLVVPRNATGTVVYDRYAVWHGTFHSDPSSAELEQQRKELALAAAKRGIHMDEDHGRRDASVREVVEYMKPELKSMGPR